MLRRAKARFEAEANRKQPRTKQFTGCWTCRRRRVKCDEAKPSCERCNRLNVPCDGYGLRLTWVHGNEEASVGPEERLSRRYLPLGPDVTKSIGLSSSEIDETLDKIDGWTPEDSPDFERSGFSVFTVPLPQDSIEDGPSISTYETPSSTSTLCGDQANTAWMSNTDKHLQPTALGNTPAPSDTVISEETFDQQNLFDAPTVSNEGTEIGGVREASQPPNQSLVIEQPCDQSTQSRQRAIPCHLDELFMPRNQKRLIHHWVTFTSRKLVLLDEPHNPCRTMMLPMALAGLMSRSAESNSNVGIFHALCACAAYNLYELNGRPVDDADNNLSLALAHDQQAIRHLRHNLARADEHRDAAFAMAIMACIAVEAVSGTTRRWRTHVSGGLAYLARLHSRGDVDEAVLAPFRRHMVLMAILCDFSVAEDLKGFLNVDDDMGKAAVDGRPDAESRLEFSFPYYGVSQMFLKMHDQMNALAAADPSLLGDEEETNRQLDAFELQLYLGFPSPSQYQGGGGNNALHATVIQHVSTSYYYAGLVYFQRSIRRAPVASVQALVELGVAELEAIDRVGKGELGCMMLWPVLVLGAECDDPKVQQRIRAWFRGQKKLGFRNLVVLEDLIAHVWHTRTVSTNSSSSSSSIHNCKRQKEGADVDWREIIALPRFDVFRL
ncbi:hypothetical protein PG987_007591 [Apiospora arundinis]